MISADSLRVVIPSRRRVESCAEAVRLFKRPLVCVAEEELSDYRGIGAELLSHPNEIVGLGRLRQWILDHVRAHVLVQCNDDVKSLLCLVGRSVRSIIDPDAIERLLLNAAGICEELGVTCFSFSPTKDVRKVAPWEPFRLTRLEGALLGFVGRGLRYDPAVSQFDDVNLSLEACLKDRFVWQDSRFAAEHNFITKGGGNSVSRSVERTTAELAHMKARWGRYMGVHSWKTTIRLVVGVPRRQSLDL